MRILLAVVVIGSLGCYTDTPRTTGTTSGPPRPPPRESSSTKDGPGCSPSATCVTYPEGAIAAEQHWQGGRRVGTWKYFYESGVRSHEVDYVDGLPVAHRAFGRSGRPRPFPALAPVRCATDADCTVGPTLSADGCCPREPDCGTPMAKLAMQAIADRCEGMYCGPPRPSSSCMGVIGKHPACVQGACTWK